MRRHFCKILFCSPEGISEIGDLKIGYLMHSCLMTSDGTTNNRSILPCMYYVINKISTHKVNINVGRHGPMIPGNVISYKGLLETIKRKRESEQRTINGNY